METRLLELEVILRRILLQEEILQELESLVRAQFDYEVSVTPLEPIIPPPKPISPFELSKQKKLTI